ncbi:MAG: DNA polymerase Y family protein [Candidatus Latescibacterota bacterium]|nr:MAG: DNA polymerase Y family protein [Candidatus Latescibacterota bacterium]
MERIACVNLDEFPLQLLLRRRSEWMIHPAAVVDRDTAQGVILWVNEQARERRILPGMRYAAALSLSSELRAGEVPDSEIEKNVSLLAERLRFFTSDVEPSKYEPGVFWLGATGLSLLYPSLKKWGELIHEDLTTAGFRASVAVGFSRFGTYAVAKTHRGAIAFEDPAREKTTASKVPIDRLGFEPNLRDTLEKLGITTLGGFLELPASGVLRRFGSEVLHLHQLAKGELWAPLQPKIPREPVEGQAILDHPETNLDRLMAIIENLLEPMRESLGKRDELIGALVIRFEFDNREKRTERIEPASPTLELRQVLELTRLRLESVSIASGVTAIALEAKTARAHRRQRDLFEKQSPRDLGAANRALARIRAELGEGAVRIARLRDGHLPEACFEWEPVKKIPAPAPRNVAVRPLIRRILARPMPFSKTRHRNPKAALAYMYEDRLVEETIGPYVVSGGWWVREVQREYYFVRTESGRWLWLYYDRRRKCWFLHGEVE